MTLLSTLGFSSLSCRGEGRGALVGVVGRGAGRRRAVRSRPLVGRRLHSPERGAGAGGEGMHRGVGRAAARAVECGRGDVEWVARTAGATPAQARESLVTTRALSECPATSEAVASGAVSMSQAREIGRSGGVGFGGWVARGGADAGHGAVARGGAPRGARV